jgi:monothiol glutaredoxin
MTTTLEKIQHQIAENPILLYMKGSPKLPSCGFSAQAVQALSACGERFAYVDILQNPDIRAELPKYANWPTFPQLWVDGELVGGCDIIIEMYQRGELQQLIKETAESIKRRKTSSLNRQACGYRVTGGASANWAAFFVGLIQRDRRRAAASRRDVSSG